MISWTDKPLGDEVQEMYAHELFFTDSGIDSPKKITCGLCFPRAINLIQNGHIVLLNSQRYFADFLLNRSDIQGFENQNRIFPDVRQQPGKRYNLVNLTYVKLDPCIRTSPSGFVLGWRPVRSISWLYVNQLGLTEESHSWNVSRSMI
jgi:hypothetical protein